MANRRRLRAHNISKIALQCNAQTPSGESAFHTLMTGFGWAKNPMVHRLERLKPSLPITVLYGSRSWVDNASGDVLTQNRPNSFTNVQVINGAGHHVYLDKPDLFNKYVLEASAHADKLAPPPPPPPPSPPPPLHPPPRPPPDQNCLDMIQEHTRCGN